MADNQLLGITDSLFGVKPKTFESDFAAALPAFKGMSATDIGTAATYAGAKQAGRGLMQMAGIEDPEMASANRAKQFAAELSQQGLSMQSSQGMKALAQKLSQAGDFKAAQAASALAMNFEEKEASIGYKQAQTAKLELAAGQEEKLRAELAALGPNPTQQQIMTVVSKYGSPDKILATLQASQDRQDRLQFQRESLAAKGAGGGKPLSASLQRAEDKDLETIDNLTAQESALLPSIQNLTPDSKGVRKLELGPTKNLKYMAQNASGNSTPESRAYEALKSAVDTAVNLQVSAEKGVQTDKDVLRFAQALIAAYGRNDTEATLSALKRYQEAIANSKAKTQARLESRRRSQGVEPYSSEIPSTATTPIAPPSVNAPATKRTMTLKSGKVVTVEE